MPATKTLEDKQKIIDSLARGNYRITACRLAGVDTNAFYHWMREGKDPSSPHNWFRVAVLKAEAGAEEQCVINILDAADGDWNAGAWLLRHGPARKRFRPVDKSEQTVKLDTGAMSDAELLEAAKQILGQPKDK